MAGLLDWQTEDERAAQQRALQAYSNQIGQQQSRQDLFDALGQTLPAQIAKSIYQAARLPGDVYQGKVDPQSPEAIGRAADFAGLAMLGSMPFAVRGALGSGGGKMVQQAPNLDEQSSLIAKALEERFNLPVQISKSKTDWGQSHYITPMFASDNMTKPFTVRLSDHHANPENRWFRNEYQVSARADNPFTAYIDNLLSAADSHAKQIGFLPKDKFVPIEGQVTHFKYGKGNVLSSTEESTIVDFGKEYGIKKFGGDSKNLERFLKPVKREDIERGLL